jgi:KUP system potassium uptake protein
MLITTVLTFFVIRYGWKYPLWLCVASTGLFFLIDVVFFASVIGFMLFTTGVIIRNQRAG